MDDKTFEFLEKILAEVQQNSKDIKKIQTSLENDIKPKIGLCLDELVSVKEKLSEHDSRFDAIESKIESQDIEIKVLKRAK